MGIKSTTTNSCHIVENRVEFLPYPNRIKRDNKINNEFLTRIGSLNYLRTYNTIENKLLLSTISHSLEEELSELSVLNFIKDRIGLKADKQCYVSFTEVPTRHKVRDLITSKIGTLIWISRQVVRTHRVHPELALGTFMGLDCQREIRNIVETVQAGDRYDYTGTLIVVPDVGVLNMPGAKADYGSRHKPGEAPEGLTGLKVLVRCSQEIDPKKFMRSLKFFRKY
ncbi:hypothetical protein GQX74_005862 [Glossina fuscipes]|nr:hypothetical protein GQX74_005862 [Glossina fuscipes]